MDGESVELSRVTIERLNDSVFVFFLCVGFLGGTDFVPLYESAVLFRLEFDVF